MYSVVQIRHSGGQNYYRFKQTDLLEKSDGDEWIKENIKTDIKEHWVVRTSDILKFSPQQFENITLDDNINLSPTNI